MVSATEDIVQNGDDYDSTVHDHTPVHCLLVHTGGEREESEDENREQKSQRGNVDGHSETAQRPPMRREWLAADTLEEQAADCNHVGGHQGADCQRHDG